MKKNEPLNYIERIKKYYQILGYGKPYCWENFEEVPFSTLKKPLKEATIGIVTTAAPYQPDKGDQGPGAVYNGDAKFYTVYTKTTEIEPELGISHIAYDRNHTMADDQGSYFPLQALKKLEKEGVFGKISSRFYGLPTNRSKRATAEVDCVDLTSLCIEDQIDAAILVPNCPVCHQSVSFAAHSLEKAGIPTVIMGCAKDIVEYIGVPRLLFNNFPLGNSAGLPHNPSSQVEIARQALSLLETAKEPRTTVQSPFEWNGKENWQINYSNGELMTKEEIEAKRAEFDKGKDAGKKIRES